jgi:hypothetical protein
VAMVVVLRLERMEERLNDYVTVSLDKVFHCLAVFPRDILV